VTRIHDLGEENWQIRESLGETWRWYVDADRAQRNSVKPQTRQDGWFAARVPRSVVDDLVDAGEIAEPRYARRSREAEWVAERSWVYRCTPHLAALDETETAWLDVQGIDPGARLFWDGVDLGEVHGLHRRARLAIGHAGEDAVAPGPHALTVIVAPATRSEPQVGVTGRVRELAPRVGQGWDFSPRLRHQGIWRPMSLVTGTTALGEIRARSAVDLHTGVGTIFLDAQVDGTPTQVTVDVGRAGIVVAQATSPVTSGAAAVRVEVPDAARWWPAGYGEQVLYDVRIDTGADHRTLRVGFRDARLVANTGGPAAALGYTALVNGVRMPLPGWNWAPVDVLFGSVDAARTRHLIDLAVHSGARLLRVWGGGVLESDAFYDACDEAGVLVWQEFSQSSSGMQSTPADDPAFLAHVVDEARHAAARLARHPSLFIWGGGNELEDERGPLDEDRSPALAAMRSTLAEVDTGRAWLPTSPSGPVFHHRRDRIMSDPDGQHDVHGPWEHQGPQGSTPSPTRGRASRTPSSVWRGWRACARSQRSSRPATGGRRTGRTPSTGTWATGGTTPTWSRRCSPAAPTTCTFCSARVSGCRRRACSMRSRAIVAGGRGAAW
jgi:beta-mannosidase